MPLEIRQWPLSAAKRSPQRRIPNSELAFSVDSPDEVARRKKLTALVTPPGSALHSSEIVVSAANVWRARM